MEMNLAELSRTANFAYICHFRTHG